MREVRRGIGGITLTIVMLVITLMIVILSLVVRQGLGSLHQAKLNSSSKQALFAAEAGAADAFRHLVEDPAWAGPLDQTEMELGGSYSAEVTNNLAGGAPMTAANGALVPAGFAYVLARGQASAQGATRQVGVLVKPGSTSSFGVAIGVGGLIDMRGSKDIGGSVKANGNIDFGGNTEIIPVNGSGRLLSSANISVGGNTRLDEAQDVRARGSIAGSVRGTELVEQGDTTGSTLPFIADGRTTNSLMPGEEGKVLPNPDPSLLRPGPSNPGVVDHTGDTNDLTNYPNLNLGGQIHYFPLGVRFAGSSTVAGPGTIVTYDAPIIFQGNSDVEANLIALAPDPTVASNASIKFQGNASVKGLLYAHEDITVQGNFEVKGAVIAYRDGGGDPNGGGDLISGGNTTIELVSDVLASVPGFAPWSQGFGGEGGIPAGTSPLSVCSWER